jgi:S1-C subfamily serine protease
VTGRRRIAATAALVAIALGALLLWAPWHERSPSRPPVVVTVSEPGATGAAEIATGFGVAPGRVVTVAHVLEPGRRLVVRTEGGPARPARVLRIDKEADLALIAVPGLAARPLRTGAGREARLLVRRGGRVIALPTPIQRRIIQTVRGPGIGPFVRLALELRANVALGDSGAPVVDANGAVAGVLWARSTNHARTAYAVDVSAISALLH